jgi:hypothetical protein
MFIAKNYYAAPAAKVCAFFDPTGFCAVITGGNGFERTLTFAIGEDPAVIA